MCFLIFKPSVFLTDGSLPTCGFWAEESGAFQALGFVDTLRKFKDVVNSCFGTTLQEDFYDNITLHSVYIASRQQKRSKFKKYWVPSSKSTGIFTSDINLIQNMELNFLDELLTTIANTLKYHLFLKRISFQHQEITFVSCVTYFQLYVHILNVSSSISCKLQSATIIEANLIIEVFALYNICFNKLY